MAYRKEVRTAGIANDAITTGKILDGEIVNADISGSAAIALSKLATDPLARANHTGTQLHTTISDFDTGVQTNRLDQMATPTADVAMGSQKITGLAAGTASGDAVEYDQFNGALDGRSWKDPVDACTAAALPAYTRTASNITADANGALPTIDGETLVVSDRLVLKDGAAGADNGIYVVSVVGDGSNPFELDRASDADTAAELDDGATVWVKAGTANGDKIFTQTATVATINSDTVTFAQTGSATAVASLDDLSDVDLTGLVDTSMLWNDAGTFKPTTVALFDNDTGQMALSTTGSSAGILIGGDAQIYRDGANELRTPDKVIVDLAMRSAGRQVAVASVTGADGTYSADENDEVVLVDTTTAGHTVDLPAVAPANTGQVITVKDSGDNAIAEPIIMTTNDSATIDGDASLAAAFGDGDALTFVNDGTNWFLI